MMKTVKELANETTTSSTGISNVQGKRWLTSIMKAAEENMYFKQFAYETEAGKGIKDVAIPLARTNKSFTDSKSQAAARTMTEIDNITAVTVTPTGKHFGANIAEEAVATSQVDVVKFAKEQIAYDMSNAIDGSLATTLAGATENILAGSIYGGDATNPGTLATGDVFELAMISESKKLLRLKGWTPTNDAPFVLFITPYEEELFNNSSQFTNAAEYGSNEVVMNGEIGKYLGFKVVVTNNCPEYSAGDQDPAIADTSEGEWNVDGHMCFALKAKVSYALVWGLKPRLDWEWDKDLASYKIYLDSRFASSALHNSAIVKIRVSDV